MVPALKLLHTSIAARTRDGLEVGLEALRVLGAQLAAHATRAADHHGHLQRGVHFIWVGASAGMSRGDLSCKCKAHSSRGAAAAFNCTTAQHANRR